MSLAVFWILPSQRKYQRQIDQKLSNLEIFFGPSLLWSFDGAAEQSLQHLQTTKPFKEEIATEVLAASTFYPAEDYHQDYYQKNPIRYKFYRYSCGRDQRLSELWGKQ